MIIQNSEGEDVEVFTADEVQAKEAAARTAVESEYKPKLEEVTGKLTKAEEAAAVRAAEFGQFRKLSEDQVKKLSEQEAIIYNNQKLLAEAKEREEATAKTTKDNSIAAAIRAKAGTDENLFKKIKDTYDVIGLDANSAEEIENKVKMAIGAIGVSEPNLVASINGFSGGSFAPPKPAGQADGTNFADTDAGKAAAKELGLDITPPKQ